MITCQAVPSSRTIAYSHKYTPSVIWTATLPGAEGGVASALADSSRDLPGGSCSARSYRHDTYGRRQSMMWKRQAGRRRTHQLRPPGSQGEARKTV